MNRHHFKKNPNQDDLFDIASQINDVKLLSDTSAEGYRKFRHGGKRYTRETAAPT